MSRKTTLLLGALLLVAGCKNNAPDEYAQFHQDGRAKPIVALMPVLDSSESKPGWSLSAEFSNSIRKALTQQGEVFLISDKEIEAKIETLSEKDRPFDPDISWVSDRFPEEEFVIFTELMEHEETPLDAKQSAESSAKLNMALRVRVIDLRGKEPQVILQEIVTDSSYVPRAFTQENFAQGLWGTEMYDLSPIGSAHAQFVKEVSQRIEEYILLAKSRY